MHDLPSLSPTLHFLARTGPQFVIRGITIRWERFGLQMADLSKPKNGVWGREREEIVQPQNTNNWEMSGIYLKNYLKKKTVFQGLDEIP